jgi:hypothetical protein
MKNAFGDEIEETGSAAAVNAFGDPIAESSAEEEKSQPGTLRRIAGNVAGAGLKAANFVGETVDRVSGAPLRQGLSDAMAVAERDPERGTLSDLPEGLAAFAKGAAGQFGRDPSRAPTMESLAVRGGLSDQGSPTQISASPVPGMTGFGASYPMNGGTGPSPAAVAGFAADLATPIPGLGELKAIGAAAKPIGKMAMMGAEAGAKAADVATGTKAASKTIDLAKGLGKSIGETKDALAGMLGAKQAPDFEQLVKTAKDNGIDLNLLPSSAEFGPSSVISRSDRVKAEGPLGQKMLEDHAKGLGQVQDAVRKDIAKIGGGAPRTRVEAGEALRDGFNAGVDRAFGDVEMSHGKVLQADPKLRLSQDQIATLAPKLQEYEAWAKKKIDLGSTKAAKEQGRQILRAVESIRKSGESYAGSLDALREIGSVAFKATNTAADVPADIRKYRALYGDLSDAMIGTVEETFDAGTAQALRESNAQMSKIFGDKSLLGEIGEKGTSPEELFKSVIEHGDSKRLAALKEYLTPEQMQALKGTFLNEMIKPTADGTFTFRSLFNNLRTKKDIATQLFEPGELDNFQHLMYLGDRFGSPVMSSSGTGASNAFMDFFRTARDRGTDALITGPMKGKARAIGFDINEIPSKAAAKNPGPGPIMGFNSGPEALLQSLPSFRGRAARTYSIYRNDQEDK